MHLKNNCCNWLLLVLVIVLSLGWSITLYYTFKDCSNSDLNYVKMKAESDSLNLVSISLSQAANKKFESAVQLEQLAEQRKQGVRVMTPSQVRVLYKKFFGEVGVSSEIVVLPDTSTNDSLTCYTSEQNNAIMQVVAQAPLKDSALAEKGRAYRELSEAFTVKGDAYSKLSTGANLLVHENHKLRRGNKILKKVVVPLAVLLGGGLGYKLSK